MSVAHLMLLFLAGVLVLETTSVQADGDDVLTVVSSAFIMEGNGDVEQVFDIISFNVTSSEVVVHTKLSQQRAQGRPLFTCTVSDPNDHTLYFFQTDPHTNGYALYNLTASTPGEWYYNTTFRFSNPLPQPEVTGVCQATRFSGFPQEYGEDTYVWFNPSSGPILAIDTSNGEYRTVALTDKQGETCCVQGVNLQEFMFYSVHSSQLMTLDLSTDVSVDQNLPGLWYFLDVPIDQAKDDPKLIVVERGTSAADNFAPRLKMYNANTLSQPGDTLFIFDEKTAGLYNGMHQTLMSKNFYAVALRNNLLEDEAEYTLFVFDTETYQLQTQITFTLPDPTFWVYGMM